MSGRHRRGRHRAPATPGRNLHAVLLGAGVAALLCVLVVAVQPQAGPVVAIPDDGWETPEPYVPLPLPTAAFTLTLEPTPTPTPTPEPTAAREKDAPPTTTRPPPATAPKTTRPPAPKPTTTAAPPKPKPTTPRPAPAPPRPPANACPTTLAGTVPHVAAAGHYIARAMGFPIGSILGRAGRSTAGSDHPSGHALDFMTSSRATGDRIAEFILANRDLLAVKYVIWQQRYNDGSGWRPMADRGSDTANHRDHVHLSILPSNPNLSKLRC